MSHTRAYSSKFYFLNYSSKPLVCLFPALFKQNLLSFIYLVQSVLPRTTVLHLLKCLSQDLHPSPWVTALVRQLERNLGAHNEDPLYTTLCCQRLKELSQRLVGSGESEGWAKCFSDQPVESESQSASCLSELGTQRKRKGSFVTLDSDGEETGQQRKRIKMDLCGSECLDAEEQSAKAEALGSDAPEETPAEELQPAPDSSCDALPEHIKVHFGRTGQALSVLSTLKCIIQFDFFPNFQMIGDPDSEFPQGLNEVY